MKNPRPTFTEFLFSYVLSSADIPDDDITKKFAKLNYTNREWPIGVTTIEELQLFFNEQACDTVQRTVVQIFRELPEKDYEAYIRLITHHLKLIEASHKASLFALRTAWKDYEAYQDYK